MKIQLIVVVVKRRVGPDGQSCGQFAVSPTKKVAVFIQMPGVMFQTSLVETSERIKFSPIGLVTRQGWGDLPEASLYSLETPRTCDSLALVVRLVDIYLGLILIESFPADDCFTAIRCPEVAGPCKIEVYLQALDSSLHAHRTIVTHHYN